VQVLQDVKVSQVLLVVLDILQVVVVQEVVMVDLVHLVEQEELEVVEMELLVTLRVVQPQLELPILVVEELEQLVLVAHQKKLQQGVQV
tara:strand:+ start:197 stop:463 length:267 start_codon:yes stop_codon:yes gene_type:complete